MSEQSRSAGWDPEIEHLDLSGQHLRALPDEVRKLTKLKALNLRDNELEALPAWLGELTQLTTLVLDHNGLTSLPESLGQLTQLTTLKLSGNRLTSLPNSLGQLTQLTGLTELWLNNNSLTSLPESLGQMTQLTTLMLSNNALMSLPASLGDLEHLTTLVLNDNVLTSLPESLGELTQLTTLVLDRNGLTSLPVSFGQLTQLTELLLADNRLTLLPVSFGQLTQLTTLVLRENKLRSLPASLGKLTQLIELRLSGNGLTSLPESLGQLTQLTTLVLDHNGLTSLPESLGQLTQLTQLTLNSNALSSLPESLGQLARLTKLNLSYNGLTSLPESLGQLTELTDLEVRANELTSLPESLGQLTQLTTLWLNSNNLTSLPESLGQLAELTQLELSQNALTSLPESLGQLARLTKLNLSDNGLTSLPESLGQLTQLTEFAITSNALPSLPESLGQLKRLTTLRLSDNELRSLPESLGQLTLLKQLTLNSNVLTSLPASLGQLTHLTEVWLSNNGLTSLPASLGQLAHLTELRLSDNGLTSLPESLGRLTALTTLKLENNGLTSLPESLGRLTALTTLKLENNRLTSLPKSFGQLTQLRYLRLSKNPLPSAYFDLLASGIAEFLRYVASTRSGGRYDLKVLLVGKGGVGKSSLIAAMAGEGFVEGRPTTHGIEVKSLPVEHPSAERESLSLNFWDFGGQEVYWTTNQLFFSRNAVYLIAWEPRDGLPEQELEETLERIRRRAGDTAQVIIVATHCNGDRRCDLDYVGLKQRFPELIAGRAEVDSSDGTGIDVLKEQLIKLARDFEHIQTPWPDEWLPARSSILGAGKEHMSYTDFEDRCAEFQIGAADARALLRLLDVSGLVVHHDGEGLRDFVVLDPEWLTKAVSYILEDKVTAESGGYLDHRTLRNIWRDHGNPEREVYNPEHFPYFLRLMEEFDVCYRVPGEARSLVAQLVPFERPSLPWEPGVPGDEGMELSSTCVMDSSPTGIIAWQTVRNHRQVKDGRHWRRGVFLEHDDGHQAIVELTDQRHVRISVRGRHPSHFSSVLRDGLLATIRDRWPHMGTSWIAPCPLSDGDGPCAGSFNLHRLEKALAKKVDKMQCDECFQSIDIAKFLLGYLTPERDLEARLDEMARSLSRLESGAGALSTQSAELVRAIFRVLVDEANHGPRVFSLVKVGLGVVSNRHRVTFWCEHPEHQHPLWGEGSYELKLDTKALQVIRPAVRLATRVMSVVCALAGAVAPLGDKHVSELGEHLKSSVDVLKELEGLGEAASHQADDADRGDRALDGSALRALHDLVAKQHPDRVVVPGSRVWHPLRRVVDKQSSDVLWVCPEHYKIYDPGLPELPI